MAEKKKKVPIEYLLGEAQCVFVELGDFQLMEIEKTIRDIRKRCDEGWEAMERVHERLGLYDKLKR